MQAILGAEIEVKTLDSKKQLNIPSGVAPGQVLKLGRCGVPDYRTGRRGDLFFTIDIKIPKKLTSKEEKYLKEIAQEKGEQVKAQSSKGLRGFWS